MNTNRFTCRRIYGLMEGAGIVTAGNSDDPLSNPATGGPEMPKSYLGTPVAASQDLAGASL